MLHAMYNRTYITMYRNNSYLFISFLVTLNDIFFFSFYLASRKYYSHIVTTIRITLTSMRLMLDIVGFNAWFLRKHGKGKNCDIKHVSKITRTKHKIYNKTQKKTNSFFYFRSFDKTHIHTLPINPQFNPCMYPSFIFSVMFFFFDFSMCNVLFFLLCNKFGI